MALFSRIRGSLEVFRAAVLLAGAFVAAMSYLRRRYRRYEVSGWSMYPTLEPGDYLVVDRKAYRRRSPEDGAVVLASDPREPRRMIVKRVASTDAFGGAYLLGDNPEASTDSRTYGPVGRQAVHGRVMWCYWPPERIGRVLARPMGPAPEE